jgi:hypothetical protein
VSIICVHQETFLPAVFVMFITPINVILSEVGNINLMSRFYLILSGKISSSALCNVYKTAKSHYAMIPAGKIQFTVQCITHMNEKHIASICIGYITVCY